jgi:putative DNA primase/helicase
MDGATFDHMCDLLRSNPDTAEWMREKGDANGQREARRIFEKAQATGPLIRVVPGELHKTASAAEAAIIGAGIPIMQRGQMLVRPIMQEVPATKGRMTLSASFAEMNVHSFVDVMCGCATWEKFDARTEDWVRINPPKNVADTIMSRVGAWTFPKVVGVITTPTIRPDGTILSAPGYDPATRLYHFADPALTLTPTVHNPTRQNAEKALACLKTLLAEFPFTNEVSRATALSGLITPIVRGALTVAPLHLFKANTAGSGKSYLVDTASAIAAGRACPVAAAGHDEAETEKRLAGLLLSGFPLVSLDNVNGELGGDLLCQAIERPLVRIRRLGGSDIIEIESRATIFATGNAARVRGDMTRRTVIADLDAEMERPELRQFKADPMAAVMANRGRYVSACLVIVRAYIIAGCPNALPTLASFSDWSSLVRSALVWLGCADPAESMEQAREDDPELCDLRQVIAAWSEAFGDRDAMTVKAVADAAEVRMVDEQGHYGNDYRLPLLRDALFKVAGERGGINTNRLGRWLSNRKGRITSGHRFNQAGAAQGGVARWTLERV